MKTAQAFQVFIVFKGEHLGPSVSTEGLDRTHRTEGNIVGVYFIKEKAWSVYRKLKLAESEYAELFQVVRNGPFGGIPGTVYLAGRHGK